MSASVVGIEKPVVIDRKQNLREHRLYWVGRRTQDVVLSVAISFSYPYIALYFIILALF